MEMRTTHAVFALVLTISVVATVRAAQVATEEPNVVTAPEAQEESQDGQRKLLVVTIQDIDLTDEQEARIAAIRKEYGPKIKDEAKELKELATEELDKIRNVFTPEQRQKVQQIIAERKEFKVESLAHTLANLKELDLTEAELKKIAEIRKEYRPRMDETLKQLDNLLTEPQKKAREEALKAKKTRRDVLQALNLSSEQTAELEAVAKELKNLVGNEAAKIRDVLTEGQKEKLQDARSERREMVRDHLAHQIANLRELNLTDEQKATLMEIRQEFRPKIQELGNNLRTSIGEEVTKIVNVIKPAGVVAERPERVQ
jgi:Spy/CpxP family protein refolding chaperone